MKTTKTLCVSLLLLVSGLLLPMSALADNVVVADANGNELTYTFETADGPATFTGVQTYNADPDKSGRIVIASTVKDDGGNSHEVQTIGKNLTNRASIVTVSIPATVTTIESRAFYNISTLETVTFATGSKLTVIGTEAFRGNAKLTSINLEACTQLTTLSDTWLYNCPGITSLTIPVSVVEFGRWMFDYTDNIETITFLAPSVPSSFYDGRKKLTTVHLGPEVKTIGDYAFQNSAGLTTVDFNASISGLEIMRSAFYNCDGMRSITLPVGLTTLGSNAIAYCDSLVTITFPAGCQLTTLGSEAFRGNASLVSINIEACTLLTALPDTWLYNCPSVRSLTIPASIETFGRWMFDYTDNIETITFLAPTVPNSFYDGRPKLTTVNIGPGVKTIGSYAFQRSPRLTTVNIDAGVSNMEIKNSAFYNCDGLKTFTLPAGVSTLGTDVFEECDSLVSFTFAAGSTLTAIPGDAFAYCRQLPSITLPDAVETIASFAFYDCTALTEVTCGTGLKEIYGSWVFDYAPVRKIVLPGAQNPFTGRSGLSSDDVTLYVHPDLVEAYHSHDVTKNFHIMAIGSTTEFAVTSNKPGLLQNRVEAIGDPNNVLTLTVTGKLNGTDIDYIHGYMPNLEVLDLTNASIVAGGDSYHQWDVNPGGIATINSWYGPWNTEDNVVGYAMFYNMPRLRSISLPKDVTKIDTWALGQDRNTNLKLKEIVIPDGVTEIGDHAFYYTGITSLTVPAGVTRLENNTFANCRQLRTATLPDAVTFIGNSCFSECHELTDVNIPAQVETIDDYAFYNNKNRTTPIVLPPTLKTIGYRAFMYNSRVTSLTFSEGLETIGGYAFSNLNAVESITLPESIKTINSNAFEGCDSITEFTFPTTLTAVPNSMFYHCDKLAKVTLAAGTTSIEHYAFQDCPKLADINLAEQTALEYVGVYAFANTGFTAVTLPNSIKEMGYSVFRSCKNLTSVNVPTLLTAVPSDFVYDCANLKDVKMHDGIRTISQYAFAGCRSLPTIELNDDITSIEYEAFYNCDSLAITKLPKALITIGGGAFRNTQSITAELTIPEGVTDLGSDAFNGSGLSKVVLPDGLVNFGTTVFSNTPNLASVKLPATLTRIPNYTFYRAESLKTIDIPKTLKEVGYAAFGHSGLTTITLPDSLQVIESYAFTYTQLQEFRVPDGLKGDPGSYTWEGCQRLKSIYLGRNQDYSQLSSFTCLHRCDSLQLLRIYAAIPPQCNSYYMGYRTNCVLEVPEDSKQAYMEADVWKEFKDIRGYFDGDVLNDLDFAVMKSLYNRLDGQHWLKPWDLSNNHRSIGKWQGVTTVGDYITAIDLSGQGLQGELTDSLFLLQHLETIDLSNNHIKGDLTTLLSKIAANEQVTEVSLKGNELTGDIYPFLSKLPNITRIDVSYNRLTAMSQPFPNDKLKNERFYRGFQFISWQTMQPVEDAPVIDVKAGVPVAIESNTLQTYRHEYGDYDFDFNSLARLQSRGGGDWSSAWELSRNGDGLWNLYNGSANYVLQAKKGEPTVYSHLNPWYSYLTYILRFDWTDGDVNVDQTVDVTDLQSVIYYALNDGKPNSQMFNYTTADANSDSKINVSDVVGSVDYILSYQAPADAPQYAERAPISARNVLTAEAGSVMLTNIDAVAAMQLTISGASVRQLKVSDALRNNFSVKMRDTEEGVRLVIYSADGHTLPAGMHQLLSGLPVGAVVTDARLSDSEAQYLGVAIDGDVTGIDAIGNGQLTIDKDGVYDLQGRRMGNWESLPEGVYIIRANGKQYKVKK